MANDPKTTTPTQPEPKLIPVRTLTFHPGMNVQVAGKNISGNSVSSTEPGAGRYWSVALDPRVRSFRVACYEPGKDPERPPSSVTMVHESVVATWVPG